MDTDEGARPITLPEKFKDSELQLHESSESESVPESDFDSSMEKENSNELKEELPQLHLHGQSWIIIVKITIIDVGY